MTSVTDNICVMDRMTNQTIDKSLSFQSPTLMPTVHYVGLSYNRALFRSLNVYHKTTLYRCHSNITLIVNAPLPVFDQKLVTDVLHAFSFGHDAGCIYVDVMVHAGLKPSTGPLGRKLAFACKRKCTVENFVHRNITILNAIIMIQIFGTAIEALCPVLFIIIIIIIFT